ncbi:MAG: SEL1-like repeat protein [Muribaculaceae bacterium]|nr:SEL1-like repeat protein [Muribaculaceae bacterium]
MGDIDNQELLAQVYRDLGACYRFGRGTQENPSMAAYYTEKAAALGDTEALDAVKLLRKDD